jgi:hypothetical protein
VAWVRVERSCWGESVSGLVGRGMNVLISLWNGKGDIKWRAREKGKKGFDEPRVNQSHR